MSRKVVPLREAWNTGEGDPKRPGGGGTSGAADPWEDCPFVPLGKAGMTYWFLDASGDLLDVPASRFAQWPAYAALCGQRRDWLCAHWPAFDKEGEPIPGAFSVRAAGFDIMARSGAMPAYDPEEPQRRYGAWPWPGGGVALHLGDRVLIDGEARRSGFREAGRLWLRQAPRPAPAPPASAEIGAEFEAALGGWAWRTPAGAALFLGLITAGALSGLLPWRPHGIVVGQFGSGKTALLNALPAFCPLLMVKNDFTEPGVRRMLSDSGAGVVLDEAESEAAGDGKLVRVIEMLRKSSSAGGLSKVQGGGAGGGAQSFSVNSSAILGCTLPPSLPPQDASRFTRLELAPIEASGGDTRLRDFLARHGLALWGRALAEAPRILHLFGVARAALLARGSAPREADQLGMIAACRWAMVEDAIGDPRPDDPADTARLLAPVRDQVARADEVLDDSPGAQALRRLLFSPLDMAGNRSTVGHVLRKLRRSTDMAEIDTLDALLQGHGLRWATMPLRPSDAIPAPPVGLYVATEQHPRLLKFYEGTAWAGGRWATALAHLPGAFAGRQVKPVTFAGGKARAVWIVGATVADLADDGAPPPEYEGPS